MKRKLSINKLDPQKWNENVMPTNLIHKSETKTQFQQIGFTKVKRKCDANIFDSQSEPNLIQEVRSQKWIEFNFHKLDNKMNQM